MYVSLIGVEIVRYLDIHTRTRFMYIKYVQRRRKFSLKGKVVISIAFVKPFDYDHFDSTSDHDSFGAKKGRAS